MREHQDGGLRRDEGSLGFEVQFVLHVGFFVSSEVCSSESVVVGLRRFMASLFYPQGSH